MISATATVASQNGVWISSVDHPSPGLTVVTFAPGAFSAAPTCLSSPLGGETIGPGGNRAASIPAPMGCLPPTASSLSCQSRTATQGWDQPFSLVCIGQ
jgi:hypothetical protein